MNEQHLKNARCYLSGPMEQEGDGNVWREKVSRFLESIGVTVFDPYHKPFKTSLPENNEVRARLMAARANHDLQYVHEYMKRVRSDDLRLCDLCDFLICRLNPNVCSLGTSEELFTCNRMKKPCFVWVEGGVTKAPLWLLGTLPPKYLYNSLDEIIKTLTMIDNGTTSIDSDRWRLLK